MWSDVRISLGTNRQLFRHNAMASAGGSTLQTKLLPIAKNYSGMKPARRRSDINEKETGGVPKALDETVTHAPLTLTVPLPGA
jgi:hypothetical protein